MDNKNLLLALVLSIGILAAWQIFLVPDYAPPPPAPAQTAGSNGEAVPSTDGGGQPVAGGETASGTAQPEIAKPRSEVLTETPRVELAAPRLSGSINLRGGQLDDLVLDDYRETLDPKSPLIVLLSPRGSEHPYYVGVRWLGLEGTPVPDAETLWESSGGPLSPDRPVTLTTTIEGLSFEVTYAIDEDYLVTITQRVRNGGDTAATLAPYALINRTGIPELDPSYIVHQGFFGVLQDTYQELNYDDLMEEPNGIIASETTGGWLGITDKYWAVILMPDQTVPVKTRDVYQKTAAGDVFQSDVTYPTTTLEAGQSLETFVRIYAGAREAKVIDRYEDAGYAHRFYLAVDYGWIFFLSRPIYLALEWFFGIVGNFGVAILLLVVCVRILLFPLANKAYKSMARMRKLQPKMQEMRERYKDDRARFQREIMALYKKEGANPLAGCLPILMQIPIFIALYNVLYGTIEMRHAPFFGWIQDLSAPDPTSWINLFGLLPYDVPNLGILGFFSLGIWPIIMGFTMWAQYRLNPQPTDPMQAKIFAWMPIVFTFVLGSFASGLVIYWAWNNALSMAQQIYIMKRQGMPIGRKAHAHAEAKAKAERERERAAEANGEAPKAIEAEPAAAAPVRAKSQSKLKREAIEQGKLKAPSKPGAKPKPKKKKD